MFVRSRWTLPALAAVFLVIPTVSSAAAQGGGTPGGPYAVVHDFAWVDPAHGTNTATPLSQINDPDQPFKTLQKAIDTMFEYLVLNGPTSRTSSRSSGSGSTMATHGSSTAHRM